MTYTPTDVIEVSAWGRSVGAVGRDPATGFYAFEYDPTWIASGGDLAPIHLPRRAGVFEFPELSRQTYYAMPAMLADALPDSFGNALVTAWMADQGIHESQISPLDRLAYAGDRAMGALQFSPPTGPWVSEPSVIQVADLVTAARAGIGGTLHANGIEDAVHQLITVGSTAGGARAKAVVAYNPATGQMRSGQFAAPEGFEQWLLKLDGVGDPADVAAGRAGQTQPFCRVEYAYSLMAAWAGVEMSESLLLPEGPRAHFITKRFDRGPDNERIHSQTLCALAHLDYNLTQTHSYGSYFLTARALGLGPEVFEQIFRRVCFNVFGVNRDDHTKNFSFILPESGSWGLAPAYDITHSHWEGTWTQGQQMSVNGRFTEIRLDDLRAMADLYEVPGIEGVLKDVRSAADAWPDAARDAGIDAATRDQILDELDEFRPA